MRKFGVWIIFVFAAACSVSTSEGTETPALASAVELNTPSVTVRPTITAYPTWTPLPPFPPAETIVPEIVKVCPPEPEVELTELGVDPKFMLYLTPNEEDPDSPSKIAFAYSWDDDSLVEYRIIPDIEDYKRYSNIGVTPTRDRLSFSIWKDDLVTREFWITALDGSDRQLIAEINFNESIFWISDDERIVIGLQNEEDYERKRSDWWDEVIPLEVINIKTGDRKPLTPLPEGVYLIRFFKIDRNYYAIYAPSTYFEEFLMYDYNSDETYPIAQWLSGYDYIDFGSTGFHVQDELITITVRKFSEHLEFVQGLDLETLKINAEYDEIMSQLILPGDFEHRYTSISFDKSEGGLQRIISYGTSDDIETAPIYYYDPTLKVLRDYCLTVDEGARFWGDYSPNRKFVAFTFLNIKFPFAAKEVIILDLSTGHYSSIRGYKVAGWGISPD